jgi:hypothetical protein
MNSNQTNSNTKNSKMSATNSTTNTAIVGQAQDNLTETLYLYIPRASLNTTEFTVKDAFFSNNIGDVEYCDLVVIKDKVTKEPQHMSVFLKLVSWNPFTAARSDFLTMGSIKLHLANEFWIILPNKTPLPRTHVNVSQLAASSDKLFEQTEHLAEKNSMLAGEIVEMRKVINNQKDHIAILQANQATLLSMLERVKHQVNALTACNADSEPTPTRDYKMTLSELDPDEEEEDEEEEQKEAEFVLPPPPPLTRNNAGFYDYENDVFAEHEYQGEAPAIQQTPSYCEDMYVPIPTQFDEDDCIFSKPLAPPASIPRLIRTVSVATVPMVLNTDRSRSSSPDDSVRASITRDICGNN